MGAYRHGSPVRRVQRGGVGTLYQILSITGALASLPLSTEETRRPMGQDSVHSAHSLLTVAVVIRAGLGKFREEVIGRSFSR
jgi:hypothetical protein